MLQMDLQHYYLPPLQEDPAHCGAVVVVLSSYAHLCRQSLYLMYIRIIF